MTVLLKVIVITLAALMYCECVYVRSSFWAPLFNPRILNYKVDANFDPDAGGNNREMFEKNYGYKGQILIANLGNGQGLPALKDKDQGNGEVRFYYTYPGADQNEAYNKT